ncbi:MAG: dipeptide epimerase [Luminiphilus sp.]|nr:dipeptide epimerase [Luminiphilus sp.]
MKAPFVTAGETVNRIEVLHVTLAAGGRVGRAETMGVDYRGETIRSMADALSGLDSRALMALDFNDLQELLPPGGARNGLDCALWDLRAKQSPGGIQALLGFPIKPLVTLYTLSLDDPDSMARAAREAAPLNRLKLKLNDKQTLECLEAVRAARPDAQLVIDANGSWSASLLMSLGDDLARLDVALLEQPLPVDGDAVLDGLRYPVMLCADESLQSSAELDDIASRYDAVNIKLDKCGGLSDALAIREWCLARGRQFMVGNMLGSSLAMAPALVAAQGADFVDLDGPLWQSMDVNPALDIANGWIQPPPAALWGQ